MTHKILGALRLTLFMMCAGACAAPHTHPAVPDAVEQSRFMLSERLRSSLVVDGAQLDTSKMILTGQVRLRSKANYSVHVRYGFSWFDEAGIQVGVSDGTSREATIQRSETVVLSGRAPFPAAVDFQVQILPR